MILMSKYTPVDAFIVLISNLCFPWVISLAKFLIRMILMLFISIINYVLNSLREDFQTKIIYKKKRG